MNSEKDRRARRSKSPLCFKKSPAIPDQFSLGGPQVKSCGGPVMAHNTNTKIFLKRAGRGRKKAVLQHSPFMPYGDCEFSITAAGVVDAVDG